MIYVSLLGQSPRLSEEINNKTEGRLEAKKMNKSDKTQSNNKWGLVHDKQQRTAGKLGLSSTPF